MGRKKQLINIFFINLKSSVVLSIFCLCVFTNKQAFSTQNKSLFNSTEIQKSNIEIFPKWEKAMLKNKKELKNINTSNCTETEFNRCEYNKWLKKLSTLKNTSDFEKIKQVNKFINNHSYIVDPINWRVKDYWASPKEFATKDGDCEDFAIAKYISLRLLGVSHKNLRLVTIYDDILEEYHSVLALYTKNNIYILDNKTNQIVPHSKIKHYKPIYSINEKNWWRHNQEL